MGRFSNFSIVLLDSPSTTTILERMFAVKEIVAEVEEQEQALAGLCANLDPATIPLTDAPGVYASLARMEKLVAGARLRLAARVEASNEWRRAGHRRAADWLAHTTGTSAGAAHAELDASGRLAGLPGTEEALRRGDLSVGQATAVTDAAAADPGAEARLLAAAARMSLRGLRDECARIKAAADPDAEARYERIHRERSVRTFTDVEGAWNLHARGPAHLGAQITAALDGLTDQLFRQAYGEGRREPRAAYTFDALISLANQHGHHPGTHKYRALVRVDLDALTRGSVQGDDRCEITGIGPVPVRVARHVLGDAIVHLVVTRGRDVATVVHLGRGPPRPRNSLCCGPNRPAAAKAATSRGPTPKSTTGSRGPTPTTPPSANSTGSAATTTASKPTTAGP
jgi:hypothetical protein